MSRRNKRKAMSDINVVPYIDVMLVLLIVFMVTAPMLVQGVQVDLPEASTEPVPPTDDDPIIVSVDKNGRYYVSLGDPDKQGEPVPLWDFDLRCTPTGCWLAVPLTRGKLALYDFGGPVEPVP